MSVLQWIKRNHFYSTIDCAYFYTYCGLSVCRHPV